MAQASLVDRGTMGTSGSLCSRPFLLSSMQDSDFVFLLRFCCPDSGSLSVQ